MKKVLYEDAMLLCLDKNYNMFLSSKDTLKICDLEQTIDALLYLLKSYGIEDSEIIDTIKSDVDLEIEEVK